MKTKLMMMGCILLAALAIAATNTRKHEAVILKGYTRGTQIQVNGQYTLQYEGIDVYLSSSSAGAPKFPQATVAGTVQTVPMAEAIAQLLDSGYEIKQASANGLDYMLVK